MADLELEVAAVVEFGPLQLAVVGDQVGTSVVGGCEGDVLTGGGGGGDGCSGELRKR